MDLVFGEMSRANANRMEELSKVKDLTSPFKEDGNRLDGWTILEWCGAMAGEAGEAVNVAKKMRRGQNIPVEDLAEELADTVIYCDLCAQKAGINLAEAIIKKFNQKSKKWNCKTRMQSLD